MTPYEILASQGLAEPKDLEAVFHPRTRDREDVKVHRAFTGALFLSETVDHEYKTKGLDYWGDPEVFLQRSKEDDVRRAHMASCSFSSGRWIDVGCGLGGTVNAGDVLSAISPAYKDVKIEAVEPNDFAREYVQTTLEIPVYESLEEVEDHVEAISMFHVLEHHPDPITFLKLAREKCDTLIVEVPHANDYLIGQLDCEAFKDFTFWSEHLILHTEGTLTAFLKEAGFNKIEISGVQRYGLANHMHWLRYGNPSGQIELSYEVEDAYQEYLKNIGATDTLWAVAR